MTRLLVDKSLAPLEELWLEGDEFHYLARVRRHGKGDRIEIQGLAGARFLAEVVALEKDRALIAMKESLPKAASSWPITLAMAVPKPNLMDDVVRKASEIGVACIAPLVTQRSVAQPSPGRIERWRKIASESRRQCGRSTPLVIEAVQTFDHAVSSLVGGGTRFILHPHLHTREGLFSCLTAAGPAVPPMAVFIGPEGGFSQTEVALAEEQGFRPVGLGASILKIETAAIAAAVLCVAALGGY